MLPPSPPCRIACFVYSGRMAPRFLITGSLGWLGKRLTRLLATGGLTHRALRDLPGGAQIRCLVLPGQDGRESGGGLRLDGGVELGAMGNVEVVRPQVRELPVSRH